MLVSPDDQTSKRAALVQRVVAEFVENFGKQLGDGISKEDFLALYHPQVEWYDHAFHIRRISHEAVLGLKIAFCHCNQPFRSDLRVRSSISHLLARLLIDKDGRLSYPPLKARWSNSSG
jgi:hypothetical protein